MTFEAWVLRSSIGRCESVIGKNYATGFWLGFCTPTGKIRFYWGNGDLTNGNAGVVAGAWTHVAVTYDGCNLRFYINGMLDLT